MYEAARSLFVRVAAGQEKLEVKTCVLFEVVYVLNGYYETSRESIKEILTLLFQSKGIHINRKKAILLALQLFAETKYDFVDCYLAAELRVGNIKEIYTFDNDLKKMGVAAIKP